MSSGLLTKYKTSGTVELSAIFPQYEMQMLKISNPPSYNANPIEYGFSTSYTTLDYIVIPSFYTLVIGDTYTLSNNTLPLIVSERSNTGFLVTVKTTGTISLNSNIFLVCLIVYFNSDVKNTLFNFGGVQFNTSDNSSIGNKFPNYTYNQFATSTSGSTQNNEFNTIFSSGKGSYSGEYNTFASYETLTRSQASTLSSAAKSFIFPSTLTGERTNSQYNCSFVTFNTSSIIFNVNTLAFFLLNNNYNNIYTYNPQFISNNQFFKNLFPRCERYISEAISDTTSYKEFTFILGQNVNGSNNTGNAFQVSSVKDYHVFAYFEYNTINGSSSTYSKFEASSAANNIVISAKTLSEFRVGFKKSNGDIWSGFIVCLVIYGNLNYLNF
jgi:hypothetical protein